MERLGIRNAERGPSSDDCAHDATTPGPYRDFRRSLFAPGQNPVPYGENEIAYVSAHLPPHATWTDGGLADVRDEIVGFSVNPEVAAAYVEARLDVPFSLGMRQRADTFVSGLVHFFDRVNAVPPNGERVIVLKAAFLRLYDLACVPGPTARSSPESLPAAWRRNAS